MWQLASLFPFLPHRAPFSAPGNTHTVTLHPLTYLIVEPPPQIQFNLTTGLSHELRLPGCQRPEQQVSSHSLARGIHVIISSFVVSRNEVRRFVRNEKVRGWDFLSFRFFFFFREEAGERCFENYGSDAFTDKGRVMWLMKKRELGIKLNDVEIYRGTFCCWETRFWRFGDLNAEEKRKCYDEVVVFAGRDKISNFQVTAVDFHILNKK